MANHTTLSDRNRDFAASYDKDRLPAIPFVPNLQTYVLTCIDPRVDPAHILELELGDAIVARNIGGRVTDAALADLAWVCHLHATKTPHADWFDLVVIHHTDCGSALLADDDLRHGFSRRFGYNDDALAAQAVLDPQRTARSDVDTLLAAPQLAAQVAVSGYAYDIATGLLTHVAGPRRPDLAA